MNTEAIIDRFVVKQQASGIAIMAIGSAPWIDALVAQFPRGLPVSFEALVKRYSFPVLEIEDIELFSNLGDLSYDDISTAIFRDKAIYETTTKAGLIQFARLRDGSYDPICFDARTTKNNREYPIVRLDHEELLCNDRIKIKSKIADSFYKLLEDYLK